MDDDDAVEAYLGDAFEEGDPKGIAHALGVIARARGMTQLARDTGVSRESLYRALSEGGNPEFATIIKVMSALGLRMKPSPAGKKSVRKPSSRKKSRNASRKAA
jgi:probable addiction module antidote protein